MAAEDITDQVTAWALDEVTKQSMGEDFGVAVTCTPTPVAAPQGMTLVPAWHLLITARNPVLAEGPLFHLAAIGGPRPKQADVRKEAGNGLRLLRDLAKSKLAAGNGHMIRGVRG
jgi:hypothetical protein